MAEQLSKEEVDKLIKFWSGFLEGSPATNTRETAWKIYVGLFKKYRQRIILIATTWLVISIIATFFISPYLSIFLIGPLPFTLGIVYAFAYLVASNLFWHQFAEKRGWSIESTGDIEKEKAYLMHRGNTQHIHQVIRGTLDNRPLRIFSFEFSTGTGKNRRTYAYTVFGFSFTGKFPHLYLNHQDDQYYGEVGEEISLPEEFEKKFILHAPKQYEIEAHQIFNPGILSYIIDSNLDYDVELVDGELLAFKNGSVANITDLEQELSRVHDLVLKFAPILDNFKFEKIGNLTSEL
ncbi:MAG: hypothetical protein AAB903_00160 [Patescibacteria group bacterium]